MKVAIGVLP